MHNKKNATPKKAKKKIMQTKYAQKKCNKKKANKNAKKKDKKNAYIIINLSYNSCYRTERTQQCFFISMVKFQFKAGGSYLTIFKK